MSSSSYHPPSKTDLLRWLKEKLPTQSITKIQQLGSGVPFLMLMNSLYPGCIKQNKINLMASLEYENVANFKTLATAFDEKGVKYQVEVAKLAARKYQDNLNLLQFMYKYAQEMKLGANIPQPPQPAPEIPSTNITAHEEQPSIDLSENGPRLRLPAKLPTTFKRPPLTKTPPPSEWVEFECKGVNPHRKTVLRAQHVLEENLEDKVKLEKIKMILLGGTHYKPGELRKSQNFGKSFKEYQGSEIKENPNEETQKPRENDENNLNYCSKEEEPALLTQNLDQQIMAKKPQNLFEKIKKQTRSSFLLRSKVLNSNFDQPISPPTPNSERLSELTPLKQSPTVQSRNQSKNQFNNQPGCAKDQQCLQPQQILRETEDKLQLNQQKLRLEQQKQQALQRELTSAVKSEMQMLLSQKAEHEDQQF